MMETPPRRWLAMRKKSRNVDASVLQRILEIFEQAIETTDKFLSSIDASDQLKTTKRWFLNLSMQSHDHLSWEKFWFTYIEESGRLRRVTVLCHYRNASTGSLENDLQGLRFQQDKSARIYESICTSLPDVPFFDTATNLRLETVGDRLHVHVTEDTNDIVLYSHLNVTNTEHIPHIKARRLVLAVIQKDLHASTGTNKCAAVPMEIPSDEGYKAIHAPRTIVMQLILNVFVNDCLRGMTGCRSSITTCGNIILWKWVSHCLIFCRACAYQ